MSRRAWGIVVVVLAAVGDPATAAPGGPGRPDLIVDANDLARDWTVGYRYFPPGHCAVQEGCVGGPGVRRLLVFTVTTANISQEALALGDPTNSTFFSYDQCHQHYHLDDFSTYEILDGSGGSLGSSTKTDWCLGDVKPYLNEPWVPDESHYSCSDQGLSPGWADVYDHGLDCQWVDVTGLPAGPYTLSVSVNPIHRIRESDYANNTSTTPITMPSLVGDPDLSIVESLTVPTITLVKRYVLPHEPNVLEGCLTGGSYRKFFKFTTHVANLAQNDLFIGDPNAHPMVVFDGAHGHFHFEDFLRYEVVNPANGAVVAATEQKYWFPEDYAAYLTDPWVRSENFYLWYSTANLISPGIQRGWRATARENFERCQVVDVTHLPNGPYDLRMSVNPEGLLPETNMANNVISKRLSVTNPVDGIGHRPDGKFVSGEPLRVLPDPGGVRILYDVNPPACPAADFILYYSMKPPSSHQYDAAICNVGTSGDVVLPVPDPPPGGLLWMILVGRDGTREGGHGFDSAGVERPLTGIPNCGITESVPRPPCLSY